VNRIEGRLAVFVFYEDGSGLDAYEYLDAAAVDVEAIDVENAEYTFCTADGHLVEATVSGRQRQEVRLRPTADYMVPDLRRRLATVLPVVGIDPALAEAPVLAAQALLDARWERRSWPRWPSWLDRRLNGERPILLPE
jgi:hypothetical protein